MGCLTKSVKVIMVTFRSLPISHLPLSADPAIIKPVNDCMSRGVDIQLKILQTLLTLTVSLPCTVDCLETCALQLHFCAALPPTLFSCTLS